MGVNGPSQDVSIPHAPSPTSAKMLSENKAVPKATQPIPEVSPKEEAANIPHPIQSKYCEAV